MASTDQAGDLPDWLAGLLRPAPDDAPPIAWFGLQLWRASVLLVPLVSLLVGAELRATGEELRHTGSQMMNGDFHPLLILFTLGLVLFFGWIVGGMAYLMGSLLLAVGIAVIVLGVVAAPLLNHTYGRVVRGASSQLWGPFLVLAIVGVPGLLVGAGSLPLGAVVMVPGLALLSLAIPPSSRAFLESLGAPREGPEGGPEGPRDPEETAGGSA